ncbi:hypothetical protein GH714_043302 [Hevea brasiliensis]|uniref:Polysaccharide biosynthesis protein C-terminal domain-containing protein n=1 Tax=Hevea brasiliensis TaxID=3981 RepID=A0A6A6K3J7_HEVBR|nr:hypothetical protein GH714_043302 [Hevea brasiliensis]
MNESVEQRLLRSEEQDSANLTSRIWTESKKIWRVAFPGMVARVTSFGIIVVTQFFLGHIGELQLAAYAIEQTFFVRFVMGILLRTLVQFCSSTCGWIYENAAVAISAFSICLNVSAWQLMICLAFLAAASVRVSNELGRGDAKAAKFAIKVVLFTSICIGVVFWILALIFGREISYIFTESEEVADTVSDLSVPLSFTLLFNSIQPVLSGITVGSGQQSIVAYINLGSYYGVGIPLGVVLGYVAHLQVKGLWIGMLCGVLTQTIILSCLIWKTNWDEQVKKASQRLNHLFLNPSKSEGSSSNS